MAHFPLFIDLENRPCLIVGGGRVALRKAEKLLPYGARVTAVAPAFAPGWGELPGHIALLRRAFRAGDLDGQTLVIAAMDDPARNAEVAARCKEARVPVNVVDDPARCTFLFPALVRRGALSIGISTGGASPAAAAYVRERIAAALPVEEGWEEILTYLAARRAEIKARVPDGAARAELFTALFDACMARGGPLTEEETERLLARRQAPFSASR